MSSDDPLTYIRETYGVPAYVGARIKFEGRAGVIDGAYGAYLNVRLKGGKRNIRLHPTWHVEYEPKGEGSEG